MKTADVAEAFRRVAKVVFACVALKRRPSIAWGFSPGKEVAKIA